MRNPVATIRNFVLERSAGERVAKRIKLLRALAAMEPNKKKRLELLDIASALQTAERRQRLLMLDYKRGTL